MDVKNFDGLYIKRQIYNHSNRIEFCLPKIPDDNCVPFSYILCTV